MNLARFPQQVVNWSCPFLSLHHLSHQSTHPLFSSYKEKMQVHSQTQRFLLSCRQMIIILFFNKKGILFFFFKKPVLNFFSQKIQFSYYLNFIRLLKKKKRYFLFPNENAGTMDLLLQRRHQPLTCINLPGLPAPPPQIQSTPWALNTINTNNSPGMLKKEKNVLNFIFLARWCLSELLHMQIYFRFFS